MTVAQVEVGPGRPDGGPWGDTVKRSETFEFRFTREELRRYHQRHFCDQLDLVGQAGCGIDPVPLGDVEVRVNDDGRASIWGVQTCGSVWSCPVCSRNVTRRRAQELQEAVDKCHDRGGAVYLVTATIPHHAGHRCRQVWDAIRKSWSYVLSGAPWGRWADRIDYLGSVRGYDVTHSERSGWHWHVHALMFCDEPVEADQRDRWEGWMRERWARKIEAWYQGEDGELDCRPLNRDLPEDHVPYFGRPHPEHGLQVQRGRNAAEYLASIGLARELTRMECKRGRDRRHRTPWQILHDHADEGRQRDAQLWAEYVRVSKGHSQHYWSPGLREELGVGDQLELDFEEAGELEATIVATCWRYAASRCPDLERRVKDAAERGGRRAIEEVLRQILAPDGFRLWVDERDGAIGCVQAERRAA